MSLAAAPAATPLIEQLHMVFNATEYTERDAFHLIGCFAQSEPAVAGALAFHLRDLIQEVFDAAHAQASADAREQGAEEDDVIDYEVQLDYSALLSMTYERTFFDAAQAAKYGTEMFAGDEQALIRCIAYLQTMVDIDHSSTSNITPIHHVKGH